MSLNDLSLTPIDFPKDYPSMQHIAEVAQKKKFNLVFAVSEQVVEVYEVLSEIIGSNARVAKLTGKDNSIANMIEEVYRNISTSVEIVVEQKPDNVQIEIVSNCGQIGKKSTKTSSCGFQGKPTISFEISIKLLHCTTFKENTDHIIKIGLLNKNETVEIAFKEMCKCSCEQNNEAVLNSSKCSNNGTFSCGICTTCNGIRSGDRCECDPDKPIDPKKPNAHCQKSGK